MNPLLRRASGAAAQEQHHVNLTDTYTFEDARQAMGDTPLPLFVIHAKGSLQIVQAGHLVQPTSGQTLISVSAS